MYYSVPEIVNNGSTEICNDVKKPESEEKIKTKLSAEDSNEKANGRAITDTGNCYW